MADHVALFGDGFLVIAADQAHLAAIGPKPPGNRPDQRRFAGAVGAGQHEAVARCDLDAQIVDENAGAANAAQRPDRQVRLGSGHGRLAGLWRLS
jgi:hypothetical protein